MYTHLPGHRFFTLVFYEANKPSQTSFKLLLHKKDLIHFFRMYFFFLNNKQKLLPTALFDTKKWNKAFTNKKLRISDTIYAKVIQNILGHNHCFKFNRKAFQYKS